MITRHTEITTVTLRYWLSLGLPATILWSVGGFGAFSLLLGLSTGGVAPGAGSTAAGLMLMWGAVVLCAAVGILLGMGSLFLRFKWSVLVANAVAGFGSLFFSALSSS